MRSAVSTVGECGRVRTALVRTEFEPTPALESAVTAILPPGSLRLAASPRALRQALTLRCDQAEEGLGDGPGSPGVAVQETWNGQQF